MFIFVMMCQPVVVMVMCQLVVCKLVGVVIIVVMCQLEVVMVMCQLVVMYVFRVMFLITLVPCTGEVRAAGSVQEPLPGRYTHGPQVTIMTNYDCRSL